MHTPRIPLARVRVAGIAILAATTLTLTACGSSGSSGSAGGPTTSQQTTNQQSGSAQPSSSEDVSMPPASSRPSGDMLPPVSGEPTPKALQGKSFESTKIEGRAAASKPLVLDFPGGDTMGASAGCNSMGGTATFTDNTFTAGRLTSTMMACADTDLMDQEQWYADWLSKKLSWTFDKALLTLSGDGVTVTYKVRGEVMAGSPGPGAADSSGAASGSALPEATGSASGQASGITPSDAGVPAPKGMAGAVFSSTKITGHEPASKPLRISFPSPSRMNATAGCNSLSGNVSFSADTMTVSKPAVTEMYCADEGLRQQEEWYLSWLEQPLSWKFQGDLLVLSGGDVTVTYRISDVIRPAQEAGTATVHTLPPDTPAPAKTPNPGHQLNPPPTTEK